MRKYLWIILVVAGSAALPACGEAPDQKPLRPIPSAAMDMPKTDPDMKKTKGDVGRKSVPPIKKSNIEFKLSAQEMQLRLAAVTITDQKSCLKLVTSLETRKNAIQRDGGMWGYIEQTVNLRDYSPIGMQTDNKINKIAFALRHLCQTAEGQEYDDVGYFVNQSLQEMGEEKFREKMALQGVAPSEVDIYIEYGRFAKEAKGRRIEYSSIHRAILKGEIFVNKYEEFAGRLAAGQSPESTLPDILALNDAVEGFITTHPLIVTALNESFQLPYGPNSTEM